MVKFLCHGMRLAPPDINYLTMTKEDQGQQQWLITTLFLQVKFYRSVNWFIGKIIKPATCIAGFIIMKIILKSTHIFFIAIVSLISFIVLASLTFTIRIVAI